jgi:broad specificity phosphatase PhoE
MTSLFLVRHGQSTWNAESRWQGQADPPLSELGEHQARAAAERLAAGEAIAAVWSSDLVRARGTAETLAGHLGLPVLLDRRLRERDAGEWTGLTRAEIEARYPGALAARRSPPGFEQDEPLLGRVMPALDTIGRMHAGDARVLVVTHGGVVRTVERELGAPAEAVPNLGGRWVHVEAGGVPVLGERRLLIDPDEVAVTVPRSI